MNARSRSSALALPRFMMALALAVGLAAACSPSANSNAPPPAAMAFFVPSVPTAWRSGPPCSDADCPTNHQTVVLFPDGRYVKEFDRALEGGASGWRGRWVLDVEENRLELQAGPDGTDYLRGTESGDLLPLDTNGHETSPGSVTALVRLDAVPAMTGVYRETGLFTYMADAALFVPCQSGIQTPVAMEGAYLELERAYLARVPADGPDRADAPGWTPVPMVVTLTGTVEARPAMEGSGTEELFVIREWSPGPDDVSCPAQRVRDTFAAVEWMLVSLDGEPVQVDSAGGLAEHPTLAWDPVEMQISGSGGCNRFTGRGVVRGTDLVSQPGLAATRRHCEGAMELEGRYLELLAEGGRLDLDRSSLRLLHGPREVARFDPPE